MENILKPTEPVNLPHTEVYRVAQMVVRDYMDRTTMSMDAIAEKLDINNHSLYKQLNPKELDRPLHMDLVLNITKLTGDDRIIRKIAEEAGMLAVHHIALCGPVRKIEDEAMRELAEIAAEVGDVSRVTLGAMSDQKVTAGELKVMLKEVLEAAEKIGEFKAGLEEALREKEVGE